MLSKIVFTILLFTTIFAKPSYKQYGVDIGPFTYEMKSSNNESRVLTYVILSQDTDLNTHFWSTYHWVPDSCPFTIPVADCHIDNGGEDFSTMLLDVVDKWNNVPENQDLSGGTFTPTNIALTNAPPGFICNPTSGQTGMLQSFNDDYGDTGWVGLAQIFITGDEITAATSKVNEYYSMSNGETQHVMCQEIGHGLPMGHTSVDGSDKNTCMDYSRVEPNKYPNKHDVELLDNLYDCEAGCNAPNPDWIGDGYCDGNYDYNNEECDWDGRDCCEDCCVDAAYTCGVVGYNCLDPDCQSTQSPKQPKRPKNPKTTN